MFCKDCKEDSEDSLLERDLSLCLPCIKIRAERFDELKQELEAADETISDVRKVLKTYEAKVEMFNGLMYAERAGMTSAENGLAEDQNPFKPEEERHIMWLSGWTAVDTRRRGLQAHAVMTWSVGVLESIVDLARGYDQQEIATKLDTVVSKYKEFVQE